MKKVILESFWARYIFIASILSIFVPGAITQHFDKNSPYQLIYKENTNDVYLSIEFIDTNTKQILNTFDLVEHNPFNKLDYPEINQRDYGQPNKVYKLDGIPLNNISIPNGKLVLRDTTEPEATNLGLVGWSFYQASISGKFLVVHYLFYVQWGEIVLGRSDAIFIFNNNGEIIHRLEGFDTNVREWSLTENGKYFSYAYGSALDESLTYFSTVGYKVINLEENKIAYQEDFDYLYNEVRTASKYNLIIVAGFSLDYHYTILNFSKKLKFTKVFTNEDLGLWKELTKDGILFYKGNRNSSSFEQLNFEKDFKAEDIK